MSGNPQDPPPPGGDDQLTPQGDPQQTPPPQGEPGAPTPVVEPPPSSVDWRDRRIGEQQQRLRERNARIAQLEAQLAQATGQQQTPQPPPGPGAVQPPTQQPVIPPPYGDIQRQINEEAARLASAQEFNRRCNEVAEAGRKVYQNFDQRVQRLAGLVDPNDRTQTDAYNSFLTAAMETGQASRLIYELGGDLNEASRIMAMEPVKMAVELTRLSSRATTTDASGAPRPIIPAATIAQNNRTLITPDDPDQADNLSTEEWMRRREEQVASRRQRTLG